jgi:flagellar biosynthesis protein FlhB
MGSDEVAIAAIALAGTSVAGIVWVMKFFAKTLSSDLQAHTKAAEKQTEASKEVLTFMKKLNGSLPRIVEQKQREV